MEPNDPAPRRSVRLDIIDLEIAFASSTDSEFGMFDGPNQSYLDLETGRVTSPESEEETEALFDNERFLEIPAGEDRIEHWDLEAFITTLGGEYIGRVCLWKDCRPGVRQDCEANTAGGGNF